MQHAIAHIELRYCQRLFGLCYSRLFNVLHCRLSSLKPPEGQEILALGQARIVMSGTVCPALIPVKERSYSYLRPKLEPGIETKNTRGRTGVLYLFFYQNISD